MNKDQILEKIREHWGDARLLSLALGEDGTLIEKPDLPNVRWHMIALEGEWSGHWMGSFALNAQTFDEMIRNFEAKQVDTLVDYEHNSLNFFAVEAPASGWIDQLQRRRLDGGIETLWGRFQWTNRAAERIDAREYRYLSPVIRFHTPDRVTGSDTGASLPSVALTNMPFLEELPEVSLSSLARKLTIDGGPPPVQRSEETMDKTQQAALAMALGLQHDAAPEAMIAAARDLGANAEDARHLDSICQALGCEPGSSADQLVTTVRALKGAQVPAEELETLRAGAAEAAELRINAAIDKAKAEGKLIPAQEAWARQLAATSVEQFNQWAESAPVVVPLGQHAKPTTPASVVDVGAEHVPTVTLDDVHPERDDPKVTEIVAKLQPADLRHCKQQSLDPRDYVRFSINSFK